jgi:2-hydroxycyclohexanecarboxyl-CoA dehydrogenase
MGQFEGQNAIVTGAAAGLGRTLASELAAVGARILVVDRQPADETLQLIRAGGGIADFIDCDIADEMQVTAMVDEAVSILDSRIDMLVNNAGFNGKTQLVADMRLMPRV